MYDVIFFFFFTNIIYVLGKKINHCNFFIYHYMIIKYGTHNHVNFLTSKVIKLIFFK